MRVATIDSIPCENRELELAVRHAQGDRAAFEEVYSEFGPMVYNLALRLTRDPEEASDLHQEAFLRIYRYLGRFAGRSSLKTWIYALVVNTGRTRFKRRIRRPQVLDDETALAELPDRRADPERRALARDAVRHLEHALSELPARFRTAVVLRDLEGFTYGEIAEIVGVRIGTVRSRIARGRERLRRRMEELV